MAPSRGWALFASNTFYIIALLALLGIGVGVVRSLVRRNQVQTQIESLQQDLNAYKSKRTELNSLIQYLSTAEFKEREARLRLGLKRPGEHVVVVPGGETNLENGTASSATGSELKVNIPNWRRWLNYFFR